jgi:S1-C subfamily serine protease
MNGQRRKRANYPSVLLALAFIGGLATGGIAIGYFVLQQNYALSNEITSLKDQVSKIGSQNITYQNITIYGNETKASQVYATAKNSVVMVLGTIQNGFVLGSGFVYYFGGTFVVITNNHVVQGTTTLGVTFSNGNGYAANVIGTDPYSDLAVLSVDAPQSEFVPLEIANSSSLLVGDDIVAIGNPYGLVDSVTTGIVSALGRTLTEDLTGGFEIPNIIQISAPINPGNSGGPLLNYNGSVVGITTAGINASQGLGFAIPSNAILREVASLINTGSFSGHPYLGFDGADNNYLAAKDLGLSVTYGWIITNIAPDSPAYNRLRVNDVIIGIDGTVIKNGDELASYLEENTSPGKTVNMKFVRGSQTSTTSIALGHI